MPIIHPSLITLSVGDITLYSKREPKRIIHMYCQVVFSCVIKENLKMTLSVLYTCI